MHVNIEKFANIEKIAIVVANFFMNQAMNVYFMGSLSLVNVTVFTHFYRLMT